MQPRRPSESEITTRIELAEVSTAAAATRVVTAVAAQRAETTAEVLNGLVAGFRRTDTNTDK